MHSFPTDYGKECYLVPIDKSLIPFVSGALRVFESRGYWQTDTDYERGYNAFAAIQDCMSGKCIQDLIEEQQRLYRLIDSALNGTVYAAVTDQQTNITTVTPPIPTAPVADLGGIIGLRRRVERLINLVDNLVTGAMRPDGQADISNVMPTDNQGIRDTLRAMQGIINAGWFGIGGERATVADIVEALRVGNSSQAQNVVDEISGLLDTANDAINIFDNVKDFFTESATTIAEGGLLTAILTATMANAAMLAALASDTLALRTELTAVLRALRGDEEAPDNILLALRGEASASATRNVIDSLAGSNQADMLLKLEQIRAILAAQGDEDLLAKLEEIRALLV